MSRPWDVMWHLGMATTIATLIMPCTAVAASASGGAKAALLAVPWDEATLAATPALAFTSAESRGINDSAVTNKIWLHQTEGETGTYDVWRMRQRSSGEPADPRQWSYVAVVVDKSSEPERAWYFEFAPQPGRPDGPPPMIAPRVDCSRCHPSGPRVIRPSGPAKGASWTVADANLLTRWNERIEAYGVVATPQKPEVPDPKLDERLTLPFCADCHDSNGLIRADLTRRHLGSITFLTSHGEGAKDRTAMPKDEPRLTAAQARCLALWAKGKEVPASCMQSASPPSAPQPSPSTLVAAVRTNLGGFSAASASVQTTVTCAAACELTATSPVTSWTTGLALRDRHMADQVFHADSHAHIVVKVSNIPREVALAGFAPTSFVATVTAGGQTARHPAKVRCAPPTAGELRCELLELDWDLTKQGLEPPSLFGLRVEPRVLIRGALSMGLTKRSPRSSSGS